MARIMIVDDDPISRNVLRTIVSDHGHSVIEACNGMEALEHFEKTPAEAVFMDIFMPVKDGVQTIRELLAANPGLRIVAVSGGSTFTSFESLEWAMFHGAKAALKKPFERHEVVEALESVVRSAQ